MRVGIMGGTFNPIHYGHLVAANEVCAAFVLDTVFFVPAAIPPHKDQTGIIDPHHRLMMTTLATLSHPRFLVSAVEIDRQGASYSVETVAAFKERYPESRALYFILGIDAFLDVATWRQPDVLLRSCHVIVTSRPGYNLRELLGSPLQQLSAAYPGLAFEATEGKHTGFRVSGTPYQIYAQEITHVDISATRIRQRVKTGHTITYLLPESVEAYIHKQQLYH